LESDVPDDLIKELIRHSIDEVILKLPKKKQEEYRNSQIIKEIDEATIHSILKK
jgi:hypothetical protein